MAVAFTSYQRSIGMDEDSARAIAAQTNLFGYQPDVVPVNGKWHLAVCSDKDAERVVKAFNERNGNSLP